MRSLVGSLPFITKSIPSGKAFCRRFYDSLSQGHRKQNYVKISKALRKDVEIWIQFHSKFNGNTHHFQICTGQAVHLSSDSFGALGCRVINVAMASEDRRNFQYFEQVPVAIHVQGIDLLAKKLVHHIDIMTVELNLKSSKSPLVMPLLCPLLSKNIQT